MFYQAEPEGSAVVAVAADHDPVVAAVEEVVTINSTSPPAAQRNQTLQAIDPNVIVIDDTQPTSTNSLGNPSADYNTTPSRKRTRKSQLTEATPKKPKICENDDDGSICPICLDNWDTDGVHRLVSLKCGHLFGDSCIRRWIQENNKCCPSCKKKATRNEIRPIYANKVIATDTTEINEYKKLLEKEQQATKMHRDEIDTLRFQLKLQRDTVHKLEQDLAELKKSAINLSNSVTSTRPKSYKLFMEKNIEISRDGGCKVMVHGKRIKSLMITQKSTQSLFPGYGIRFIDSTTFRPSNEFLHASTKQMRDLCLDNDDDHLLTTSLDKGAKLFSVQQRRVVSTFSPDDQSFWAAAFDCDRPKFVYLGAERGGSTFIYDIRNPQTFVQELKAEDDKSPIIKICPMPSRDDFPFGGFFVCKLSSVWFYEFDAAQQTIGTKLAVDGPFISMSYEAQTQHIVISARPTSNHRKSRFIVAELMKVEDSTHIRIWGTCLGSTVQSAMRRSAQIRIDDKNSIVAAYLEDTKSLCTWTAPNCARMTTASLGDPVVDLCPIYSSVNTYLTALSDNRCRVYKLEVSET
ncbi:E3 ubiquitin-protein ligase RFWD3 [Bradysia coprophila]|uniref:E3 ubiquitin-protein ligase RFWD3 n=1 Tax=Bradysia coprophila TaxID=38358 RepID=UPI00187D804C|nr:E3 ubiquitin-protein ligase RFWD3 [Bradysia coprophila]